MVHGPDCFIYDLYLKATKNRTQIECNNQNADFPQPVTTRTSKLQKQPTQTSNLQYQP